MSLACVPLVALLLSSSICNLFYCTQIICGFWQISWKGRDHLGDLDVDGMILLKWILYCVEWTRLALKDIISEVL
jgi:hypothetical protein